MSYLDSYGLRPYTEVFDKRIVLLQSGGLDSCVMAHLFSRLGYEVHHLFVDYGFKSVDRDFNNVKKIIRKYGGILHKATMKLPWLESSTVLVDSTTVDDTSYGDTAMNTYYSGVYVPMRNSFLISIAWSLAESLKIPYVVSALDGVEHSITHEPLGGTSDKHPKFANKLEEALNEGSSMYHIEHKPIFLLTPIIGFYKEDTINLGYILGTDFSLSNSCYNNGEDACGKCSACKLRIEAFKKAGVKDTLKYSIPIDF